jgi:hypothetical protein
MLLLGATHSPVTGAGTVRQAAPAVAVAVLKLTCLRPGDVAARPGSRAVRITNFGIKPTDPSFLRPDLEDPGDTSIEPWMILERGDSYAIGIRVLDGPAGTRTRVLDARGDELPPKQVDHEGHPYVTVPWGESVVVRLQAVLPEKAAQRPVRVHAAVWSLNNTVVRAEADLELAQRDRSANALLSMP